MLLLGLAAIIVLGGLIWLETRPNPGLAAGNVSSSGAAAIGGPFRLVDQDGRAVDERVLKGKWSAVFFGYTYCPDTCPTTLQTLAAASDKLGARAKDLQVVLITVDPARDTPKQLKLYLSNQGFPKQALGLTGAPEQVAAVEKAYKVYAAKNGSGDDYLMDHTAAIYLMNPQGRFARPLSEAMKPDGVAQQIREAMAGEGLPSRLTGGEAPRSGSGGPVRTVSVALAHPDLRAAGLSLPSSGRVKERRCGTSSQLQHYLLPNRGRATLAA